MLLASVLLSLLGACIAHEDEPDGIDFLQKITENTIYKHRVKLLRPGSGCLCSVEKVRVYVKEQLSALGFISTCLSDHLVQSPVEYVDNAQTVLIFYKRYSQICQSGRVGDHLVETSA